MIIRRTTRTAWGRQDIVEYLQPGPVTPWNAAFGPRETAQELPIDHFNYHTVMDLECSACRRGQPYRFDIVDPAKRYTVEIRVPRQDGSGVEWVRDTRYTFENAYDADRHVRLTRPDQYRIGEARIVEIPEGGES